MSRLNDLLRKLENTDPALAKDLKREVEALAHRRAFGLNFERHVPEAVELPGRPVRRGDKVRILPPRGSKASDGDPRLWRVVAVAKDFAGTRTATLELIDDNAETAEASVDDLVVVAEFRDPIYPGLVSTGKVERGGDKPYHTVINAENYHALQTLLFTHRGKVDAIYIDPPYNTGAKDWKYNNDYVEGDDLYRHSKWLAFMERRLKLAKELLNPDDSVLIVTIDEKEYLRLGLLLEQTFPDARIQMVSVFINPKGVARSGFARTDEYYYFVMNGDAEPRPNAVASTWRENRRGAAATINPWASMLRRGTNSRRADRPNLFYPIFIDEVTGYVHSFGQPLPLHATRDGINAPEGTIAIWPLRTNGDEGNWQVGPDSARELHSLGMLRAGRFNGERTAINYLFKAERAKVERGDYVTVGREPDGSLRLDTSGHVSLSLPGTQWTVAGHDAGTHGSILALRNQGCRSGLNPPASSSDRAM